MGQTVSGRALLPAYQITAAAGQTLRQIADPMFPTGRLSGGAEGFSGPRQVENLWGQPGVFPGRSPGGA